MILEKPVVVAFPVSEVQLTFKLKEEIMLDDFQLFIIGNIKKGLSIEDICTICLFHNAVIEQTIEQMIEQNLLEKDDNGIIRPSEVSLRIIEYSNILESLANRKDDFSIDLVTGKIFETKSVNIFENSSCIKAKKVIHKYDVESLNIADDSEFFKMHFESAAMLSDEELTRFLNSIIITASCKNERWMHKSINILPDFPDEKNEYSDEKITIRMYMRKFDFSLHNRNYEGMEKIIDALRIINNDSPQMLSSIGLEYLKGYFEFIQSSRMPRSFYISQLSGEHRFDVEVNSKKNKRPAVIELSFPEKSIEEILEKATEVYGPFDNQYILIERNEKIAFDVFIPFESFIEKGCE